MKKLLVIVSLVIISFASSAQITGIVITKDSSIVIDRIYAGSLSGTMFHTDSIYTDGFTGVRFGAMATYKPLDWLSFSSWAMVQIDGGASPWSLQQFYTTISPSKKLTLQIGSMASLPTEQRPHPVSGNGQFETWSESQIPGGGLGAKVRYQFNTDFQLAGGVVVCKGLPEYSGKITYKKLQVSGWYSEYNNKFGTALTLDLPKVYNTFVWKQNQVVSNLLVVHIVSSKGISLYSDNGYHLTTKKLVRSETGAMKTFKTNWIKGLFSIGYNYKKRTVNGYLFVHL